MAWHFGESKNIGPFRATVSKKWYWNKFWIFGLLVWSKHAGGSLQPASTSLHHPSVYCWFNVSDLTPLFPRL